MKSYLIKEIPDELMKAVKVRAAQEGVTMKELILRYIEEGLKKEKKEKKDGKK